MTIGLLTASYITSSVLFILALGGLSNQEKAKRAVWYGIVGMVIAVFARLYAFPHSERLSIRRRLAALLDALPALVRAQGLGAEDRQTVVHVVRHRGGCAQAGNHSAPHVDRRYRVQMERRRRDHAEGQTDASHSMKQALKGR